MAKPEKGSKQTVERWEGKGWTSVHVPAGSTDPIDVSFDPATQDMAVKRQLFDAASGQQMTGHGKPKVVVTMSEGGGTIALAEPAEQEVVVLYKVTEEDEDEEPEDAA